MRYLVDFKKLKNNGSDECEIKEKDNTCKNTYEDSFVGTVLLFINVIIVLLALLTISVISVAYLNRAINVDMKVLAGFYLCNILHDYAFPRKRGNQEP